MTFQYTKRQIFVKFEIISCFVFNFANILHFTESSFNSAFQKIVLSS